LKTAGDYYDITPLRSAVTLTNPFAMVSGSSVCNGHRCKWWIRYQ
jgi:hypothetical protein